MTELNKRLIDICRVYLIQRNSNNRHLKIDEDLDNSVVTINCFEDTKCYENQKHPKILGSISIREGKTYLFNKGLDENFENYAKEKIKDLKELHLI